MFRLTLAPRQNQSDVARHMSCKLILSLLVAPRAVRSREGSSRFNIHNRLFGPVNRPTQRFPDITRTVLMFDADIVLIPVAQAMGGFTIITFAVARLVPNIDPHMIAPGDQFELEANSSPVFGPVVPHCAFR